MVLAQTSRGLMEFTLKKMSKLTIDAMVKPIVFMSVRCVHNVLVSFVIVRVYINNINNILMFGVSIFVCFDIDVV